MRSGLRMKNSRAASRRAQISRAIQRVAQQSSRGWGYVSSRCWRRGEVFGVAAHVGADPGEVAGIAASTLFPHPVVLVARAVLGGVGVLAAVPGVGVADVGHDRHLAGDDLAEDGLELRRVEARPRVTIVPGATWNFTIRLPRL